MNELNIVYFNTDTKETESIDGLRLKTLWEQPLGFFWADINNTDVNALSEFLSSLDINCIWTDHFDSPEILPHLHDTPTSIAFYLYDIEHVETLGDTSHEIEELSQIPLLVIIGKRFVITYHQKNMDLIDYLKKDCASNFKLAGKTPAFIIFLLFQHSVYHYARLNLVNDNFLDVLEFGIISGKITENMPKISTAGFNILMLKKLNANLHIIILMLVSKQSYTISEDARASFNHILADTVSIREAIDSSRYLLDSIIAGIQADSAHKTGKIIQILTIISAIFMPLTLITGIYGMNFHVIPGLDWNYGFYATIAGMVAIVIIFLSTIKYFGWIGEKKMKNKRRRRHKRILLGSKAKLPDSPPK